MSKLILVAAMSALLLAGCATAFKSVYEKPGGKTLLVSKNDWAGYQEYLGKIGSTRTGAFAVAVYQGTSDGWASSWCPGDVCYGGQNPANEAMSSCRQAAGADCVLFAHNNTILVNYKIVE